MNISLRQATSDDLPFVYNSWLKAYKHSSRFAQRITNEVFFKYHHQVIDRILARGAKVLIATPENDEHTILGYIVYEPYNALVLHFCYVKMPFRRFGVAHKLLSPLLSEAGLNGTLVTFSHWTKDMDWASEKLKLQYNPYLI